MTISAVAPVRPALPASVPLTLADYHALPEGPPYYEFEGGELILMNRPHANHQAVILKLGGVLDRYVTEKGLGQVWPEVEVDLDPGHGYIPDLTFLAKEHAAQLSPQGVITGAPDLVVEVLSPTTARRDRTQKFRAYQAARVAWLWLVDADDLLIEEYRWTPDGYLRTQTVAPGEVFAPGVFLGLNINLAELRGTPPAENNP